MSSVLNCTESTAPGAPTSNEAKKGGHALVIPRGAVIVDGTIGAAEWAPALQLPLNIAIAGGTSVAVDLRLLQDQGNLYASARVPRSDVTVVLGINYDNNDNGVVDAGEDYVFANTTGFSVDGHCGSGNCSALTDAVQNMAFASRTTANTTEIELSHPLDSGDSNDIAVGNNGKLAANLLVSLIGAGGQPLGFAYYPGGISADFADFRIAHHSANLKSNYWTTVAPLPTPRYLLAAGTINGVLYAVGGASNGASGSVEAYDPATNSWTAKASLPTPRYGLAVGVINGILYAAGGVDGNQTTVGTVEAYDPVTNSWTTKAPLPTPRYGLAVGVINGILYAAGGVGQGGFVSAVEAYNPATNSWTTKAPLPTPWLGPAGGVVNGVLYVVGGYFGLSTVEAYDPVANSWTAKAALPTGRYYLTAAVVNGTLYAVGGADQNGFALAAVEAYDPVTNSWTTKALLPTPRYGLASGVINGLLYAVGGVDQNQTTVGTVEAYRP